MKNDESQPQNAPVPPTPDADDDADYPAPTLTTPGGRFWEIPLDPKQQKALDVPRRAASTVSSSRNPNVTS